MVRVVGVKIFVFAACPFHHSPGRTCKDGASVRATTADEPSAHGGRTSMRSARATVGTRPARLQNFQTPLKKTGARDMQAPRERHVVTSFSASPEDTRATGPGGRLR